MADGRKGLRTTGRRSEVGHQNPTKIMSGSGENKSRRAGGLPRMSIEAVYIFTQKQDVRLTRICVASIRFWYPDLPIFLIKDELRARFDTEEIERIWNVGVERCGRPQLGGCGWLIKFEPLFLSGRKRVLTLDSDIAFCGPVLGNLDQVKSDFVVAEEYWHGPLSGNSYGLKAVDALFFDTAKLRSFDPEYVFPGRAFNGGQMVITTGLLGREDFAALIEWSGVPRLKRADIFRMGDQGVWNYLLQKCSACGTFTLDYANFMVFQGDSRCSQIDLDRIQSRQGFPFLIHWAGKKPPFLSSMNASKVLRFYEDYYYGKVPRGWAKRWPRVVSYAVVRACELSRQRTRRALRRSLMNLGVLDMAKRFKRVFLRRLSS